MIYEKDLSLQSFQINTTYILKTIDILNEVKESNNWFIEEINFKINHLIVFKNNIIETETINNQNSKGKYSCIGIGRKNKYVNAFHLKCKIVYVDFFKKNISKAKIGKQWQAKKTQHYEICEY